MIWVLFSFFLNNVHLAVPEWVWGLRSSSWNVNPIQVPPDDSIFAFCLFGFLLITPMQDWTCLVFNLIWIEFILIPFWIQLNNNKKTSWVRVRCPIKEGLHQSGTSWYPVITTSNYKVTVLILSLINDVTYQYTDITQNTPHKTSPGEGLQSLIALFLVIYAKRHFCL